MNHRRLPMSPRTSKPASPSGGCSSRSGRRQKGDRARSILAVALCLTAAAAQAAESSQAGNVRLLCSFEPEELAKFGYKTAPYDKLSDAMLLPDSGMCGTLGGSTAVIRKSHATDGQWALCHSAGNGGDVA